MQLLTAPLVEVSDAKPADSSAKAGITSKKKVLYLRDVDSDGEVKFVKESIEGFID